MFFYGYLEDRKFDYHFSQDYRANSQTSLEKDEITPVTAIGFDKNQNMLILGDVFGNVQLWEIEKLVSKAENNKKILKDRVKKRNKNHVQEKLVDSVMVE